MSRKNTVLKLSLLKIGVIILIFHSGGILFSQGYEWGIDKQNIKEQEKRLELDSILIHLKNNWQLSISYGQFYFDNSAKSKEVSFLEFPRKMNAWNLSFARYLSENLSVNSNLGILLKKIEPPRPDIFSVINGSNIEIEGGGIILMPIGLGIDYYFLKQRFRPYAGFGFGAVLARSKYVEASGNISIGINRDEYEFIDQTTFVELSSGFIYRTGEKGQLGLNFDYLRSKDFSENIGGYKAHSGIKISAFFSFFF